METTRALRHGPAITVPLVALFEPGVTAVVVAVALPEPRLVMVEELEAGNPFRALPEVQFRHEESGRATVLPGQRLAVDLPDHPRPTADHVGELQARRVTPVGERNHMRRSGERTRDREAGVDGD